MEAATAHQLRLHHTSIRTAQGRLYIDGLVVEDELAARLVSERIEAGEDPARTVADALAIGARVLDREATGANVEMVRSELERVSREVEATFADRTKEVSEKLAEKVDEVFSPERGHLTKALHRHFDDESAAAVQHRVKALVHDVMTRAREDLLRQFSAADGHNPLADFKAAQLAQLKRLGDQQDNHLRALQERLAGMERELQRLHDAEKAKEELEAERSRGTAKGRAYEEIVFEAIDAIAHAQGDDCDAVGDLKGATRRTGDIVVGIDACRGPARGRILFEAKDSRLSKPEALRELDRGLRERDADMAVLVVCGTENLPARIHQLREYNGDKLIVAFDPEQDEPLVLELAYSLARARVLLTRSDGDGVDAGAIDDTVERALAAMEDVRRIKSQLTGATTSIEQARSILEAMADRVRTELAEIQRLLAAGEGEAQAAGAAGDDDDQPSSTGASSG
jgi:urease gamma subunit